MSVPERTFSKHFTEAEVGPCYKCLEVNGDAMGEDDTVVTCDLCQQDFCCECVDTCGVCRKNACRNCCSVSSDEEDMNNYCDRCRDNILAAK